MSVNIADKVQNNVTLMNVSHYDSKAEYIRLSFLGVETDEEADEVFADQLESGFIHDITCGTYNGATDEFTPWQLNNINILDTIWQALNEDEFIFDMVVNRDIIQEDWNNDDYIREYTEVYEVFIIDGRVYVNKD